MKVENIRVSNFENALRGMRNPMNSWHHIDSAFGVGCEDYTDVDWTIAEKWAESKGLSIQNTPEEYEDEVCKYDKWLIQNGVIHKTDHCFEYAFIGPKDMDLAKRLIKAGPEHSKFLRQIFVSMDITAPLYW